jgi:regulator of protease activity HflC (stomatin/prohibitin superfamily)
MLRRITPTIRAVVATSSQNGLKYAATPVRSFASYVDFDDDLDNWPKTKMNTLLNVCPQGEQMVVERLGKFDAVKEGGWFIAIPLVDQITFVVDMREKALSIPPQQCITKDNVKLEVSGNLYCQFNDAAKAAYGSKNPIHAVKQHAQSSMRAAIGELELDEILHARAQLNTIVRTTVQEAAESWGLVIKRYEITEGG